MKACALIPALDAEDTIGSVLEDVKLKVGLPVIVVDDGSKDDTSNIALERGAIVLRHNVNRGKGAAIVTGLTEASRRAFECAVTLDADSQHPATSVHAVLTSPAEACALVLGVRNLLRDGAPRSNRFGNFVSNWFISAFSGKSLHDTQCGLRRYPVRETLALEARSLGFAFEAEVLLRAIAAGMPIAEVPVTAEYSERTMMRTHFRNWRDPAAIVCTVVHTMIETRWLTR
jgi:glycosyltransferase involved in cell wall biosynthesis